MARKNSFIHQDDPTVIRAAQDGNRHAQRVLIKRHQPLIHTVADRYRSFFADHDDLRQEGSIGFCKAIRNFDATRDASFSTFAQLCIKRQIISALRAATTLRHGALNQSLPIDAGAEVADTAVTPETRVMMAEAVADIRKAVAAGLTDREYRVLCAYLDGKTYLRIAAELGLTTKHIDNTLMKVRQKLENILTRRTSSSEIMLTALQELTAA